MCGIFHPHAQPERLKIMKTGKIGALRVQDVISHLYADIFIEFSPEMQYCQEVRSLKATMAVCS